MPNEFADVGKAAHIVLVGIPGSGKSSTGHALARALRWPLFDLDEQIAERAGMTVAEIFATHGEGYFRAREREVTQELAQVTEPMVVAPGGGWITVPGLPELLRPPAQLVWLKVSPQKAIERMGKGVGTRPMLAGPTPLSALTAIAAAREKFYLQADHTVSVELMTPSEAADAILALAQP
ncbi:MAG TPA: shikimate kinase [Gemmatimonadaceae bacterium]